MVVLYVIAGLALIWAMLYWRVPFVVWTLGLGAVGAGGLYTLGASATVFWVLGTLYLLLAAPLNLPWLRRPLISRYLFAAFRGALPSMSATEREALEAGTVWWDAELFSGRPDFRKLLAVPPPTLSEEERRFLDGPVNELCEMLDDWQIIHELRDLPPEAWRFLKEKGFFGMIIPKEYGGLEFSALGHSSVVTRISTRSLTAAVTVMVPNSLGPAELLLHYGTEEQKQHYLPRLARGEEVPCFALTGPEAGSDAGAMPDNGVVCRGEFEGKKDVLGIRLNWNKRYITLAPVATVLGLAFKLYDPDKLLGDREDLGITVALIPTNTPGITIGRRHDPLGVPFQNGPTQGADVFIPVDWIIGGPQRAGQGWRMLMESLAAGRSISLPAVSAASGKFASRTVGAYSRIRRQFNLPIGRFEGIEEVLARIAGYTYMMDAGRTLTLSGVDAGEKPSVISAIVKYQLTEHMRRVVNDAMDVRGGSGICMGPRNQIGRAYQMLPVGITVEGANILTRSLIIYGQGAIRCHPYIYKEISATRDEDPRRALREFDRAIFGHIGFVVTNAARSLFLALSGGRFARVPLNGHARRYAQHVERLSAAFAICSDLAMLTLAGDLKRKEKISGRFADALSYLYLTSALIKRFVDDGQPKDDLPLFQWAGRYCLNNVEEALDGMMQNFPVRVVAWLMRRLALPLGRYIGVANDHLGHKVAGMLLEPSATRDRLTADTFISTDPAGPLHVLEDALAKVIAAEPAERRLRQAIKEGLATGRDLTMQLDSARAAGAINREDMELIRAAEAARLEVIQVDDFSLSEFGAVVESERRAAAN
ncbi:MAG: acyl-CoA dehydrogenase [Acidiferrobacteraceae bacterium]|jgi:acyl-CoA dehydrogenase